MQLAKRKCNNNEFPLITVAPPQLSLSRRNGDIATEEINENTSVQIKNKGWIRAGELWPSICCRVAVDDAAACG